jgi:UPF0176 protein
MKNILFYKFLSLTDLPTLQQDIQALCTNLKGKILLADEGINGCVSGTDEDIDHLTTELQRKLGAIEFKEGEASTHTFKKMFVRIKKEIITFKQPVDMEKTAAYIEPHELKAALDNEEEIILLDARNNYESRIGKFDGAITPDIVLFSELPMILERMPHLKEKRIVTYCTGGIRCEKSSAWMRENGFTNVQQLHGGIIRYGLECGNAHWEGKCFVFDRRGTINIDPSAQSAPISNCELCSMPCSEYHNCAKNVCDKYFLCCEACLVTFQSCCSEACKDEVTRDPALRATTFVDEERPQQLPQNSFNL